MSWLNRFLPSRSLRANTLLGFNAGGDIEMTQAAPLSTLVTLHLSGAGAPVDYTDGDPPATGEGTAPKGAIYSDTSGGNVYRNSGTQAEPVWTMLADAAP